MLTAGQHTYRQTGVIEGRRCNGGPLDGNVSTNAEDSATIGFIDHGRIHLCVVGGRNRVPGSLEVAVAVFTH